MKARYAKVKTALYPEVDGKRRKVLCGCVLDKYTMSTELGLREYNYFHYGEYNSKCPKCNKWYFYKIKGGRIK